MYSKYKKCVDDLNVLVSDHTHSYTFLSKIMHTNFFCKHFLKWWTAHVDVQVDKNAKMSEVLAMYTPHVLRPLKCFKLWYSPKGFC